MNRAQLTAIADGLADIRAFPGNVAPIRNRPTRMVRDRFTAWLGDGTPIDVSAATSIDEARDLAAPRSSHKGNFVIQHDRADARRFLHVYGVTRSTKNGTWRASLDGGPKVFEGNLEPKHLMEMQVYEPLAPVPPWHWTAEDSTGAKHGVCPDLIGDAVVEGRG